MRDFFHKYEENPTQLGFLLIVIGCVAGFGYAIFQFYFLSFRGFGSDLSPIGIYSLIVPLAGTALGILGLKFRNSMKHFTGNTNYKVYIILIGIGFLILSNFFAGILMITASILLFYKK